jgi:hypothetical protein
MEVVAEKAVTPSKSGRPKMNDAPVTPHTAEIQHAESAVMLVRADNV